jgi:hypothetical protein
MKQPSNVQSLVVPFHHHFFNSFFPVNRISHQLLIPHPLPLPFPFPAQLLSRFRNPIHFDATETPEF